MVAAETATQAAYQYCVALSGAHPPRTLELRLDYLNSARQRSALLRWVSRQRRRPALIATCRRREAGGEFAGSVEAEIAILAEAVRAGCRWCDVEIESASGVRRRELRDALAPARLLISAHDFRRVPRDLRPSIAQLDRAGGDAVKIAAACRSFADASRLLALVRGRRDMVVIPMGEAALGVRLLALREGGALAYAPVGRATAPGQLSFEATRKVYRLDRRFGRTQRGPTTRTRVYGVIGDPIAHSLSPLMHNAAFAARDADALFVPFPVRDLADFIAFAKSHGLAGFSVTLPHKQRILRYLDRCDGLAADVGAVQHRGHPRRPALRIQYGLRGRVARHREAHGSAASAAGVLLVGAGGVARAAAFALARAGAAVAICARRPVAARALARAVGGDAVDRRALRRESFDAILNCTARRWGCTPAGDRRCGPTSSTAGW